RLHRRERIETLKLMHFSAREGGSSRLHRRERIETILNGVIAVPKHVPPGFIAGSGLKHSLPVWGSHHSSSSRLHRRERIETVQALDTTSGRRCSSRLHRRERIETPKTTMMPMHPE